MTYKSQFITDSNSIIFATSDALSHYIIMMYEVSRKNKFNTEIEEAINIQNKNSNAVRSAILSKPLDFENDVLCKLLNNLNHKQNLNRHLERLKREGFLLEDDYSVVLF